MVEKVLQLLRGLAAQAGENVEFGAAASLAGPFTKGTPVITVKPNSAPVGPAPAAGTVEALAVTFSAQATGTAQIFRFQAGDLHEEVPS